MNKSNHTLIKAFNLGYRALIDGSILNPCGIIINESISARGYKRFCIGRYSVNSHRLVAFQKFGDEIFKEGIVVRHLNGNRLDNRSSNIEIGSHSDNMQDIPKENRVKHATKASRKMQDSIRCKELRYKIYTAIIKGMSYKEINEMYGVAKSTLSCMKNKSKEFKEFKDSCVI